MAGKKKTPKVYEYGRSANPTNWFEAADALKSVSKSSRTGRKNAMFEKLSSVEQLLKDHK